MASGLGDESVELSGLGSRLFGFAVLLGIGLIIFGIGKTMTTDATDKVQKQLETIQQSEFSDYDQKPVLATKVKAAYQSFSGKGVAILVATRMMIDEGVSANGLPVDDPHWEDIQISVLDGKGGSVAQVEGSDGYDHDLWCINYNAILSTDSIYAENGDFVTDASFLTNEDTGSIEFYNKTSNMGRQGYAEYLPASGQFQSTLIKDTTGQVVGIVFVQTSSY